MSLERAVRPWAINCVNNFAEYDITVLMNSLRWKNNDILVVTEARIARKEPQGGAPSGMTSAARCKADKDETRDRGEQENAVPS